MPARPTEPLAGLTNSTGHFEDQCDLGAILGEGGIGSVRCGHQRQLGRSVAVKTVRGSAQVLVQEAAATAAVAGPGVPAVYGMGHDDHGQPALFMSRVEGRDWRSLIGPRGRLLAPASARRDPLDWHLGVLLAVAAVVERAHARGIIHRDIKPGNVLVTGDGAVSLIDWGLAAAIDDRNPALRRVDDIQNIEGTTGCLAPEMVAVRSRLIGTHTDVFLLGTCLHMLLTGHVPYRGADVKARIRAAFRCETQSYPASAPAALVAIARRAMSRKPGARFPSVAAFRAALVSFRAARSGQRNLALARDTMRALEEVWHAGAPGDVDELWGRARRQLVDVLHVDPSSDEAMALLLLGQKLRATVARLPVQAAVADLEPPSACTSRAARAG